MHGGGPEVTPGKPLADTYTKEDLVTLKEGCQNLARHIENSKKFGVKVIIAINQFALVLLSYHTSVLADFGTALIPVLNSSSSARRLSLPVLMLR
jgi:formyltetrahydrofolate synthetase